MMAHNKIRIALALAMALVLVTSLASAGAIAQEDGQESDGATTVDSCTTITEPGTYELADDLTNATANTTIFEFDGVQVDACVVVASDDVVLNGGGNAVEGSAEDLNDTNVSIANQTVDANLTNVTNVTGDANETAGGNETFTLDVGVAVVPLDDPGVNLTNVTVRDLGTAGWYGGVYADNVTESSLQGINASGNAETGLILDNVTAASVGGIQASDNGDFGVIMHKSHDNVLTDVSVENDAFAGLVMFDSHRNELSNVTATNQSIAGIGLLNASNNTLSDVEVRDTEGQFFRYSAGLLFDNASDNFVVDVTASDNRNWTYHSTNESTDNLVLNLTTDDRQLSFVATDVALRFDENASDEPGMPFVALDTGENASILVDVNWSATGAPTDVAENETLDAGDNLTDADAANATGDQAEAPANATDDAGDAADEGIDEAGNETANETAEPANATGDDADPAGEEIDETENETAANETVEPANETDGDAAGEPVGEETDEAENETAVNETTNETANAF